MDADDLTAALAGTPKPGRDEVLGSFQRKHRRKKTERRLYWVSGVTACAVAAAVVVSMTQPWSKGPAVADSAVCEPTHMTQTFAQAKNAGASILIADAMPATQGSALGYTAVLLRSVQTLSGPAIAPGTIAWSHEKAAGTSGKFFAVVWPKRAGTIGPIIRTAPVIGDKVIFSSYGCRDAASVPIPTSSSQSLGGPNGLDGSFAISLRAVEAAAAGSPGGSQAGDQDNQGQQPGSSPSHTASPRGGDGGAGYQNQGASPSQGAAGNQGDNSGASNGSSQGGVSSGNGQSGGSGQSGGNGKGSGGGSGNPGGGGSGKSAKSGSNSGNGQH